MPDTSASIWLDLLRPPLTEHMPKVRSDPAAAVDNNQRSVDKQDDNKDTIYVKKARSVL
jgi:hypothetical protein